MLSSGQIEGYFGPDQVKSLGYDNTVPKIQTLIAQYSAFANYLNLELPDGKAKDETLDHLSSSFDSACQSIQEEADAEAKVTET